MKIAACVGMPGSGKSEVARTFENSGFVRIRFGDITDEEALRRSLLLNEENERIIREQLRREHGMAAYAELNLPKINNALNHSNVVIDGLYSWEEYLYLKSHYKDNMVVIAVWASPAARYGRLISRAKRPLTPEEAASRDRSEIENVNKGGPIAMADFIIVNESTLEHLRSEAKRLIALIL
jgi:dephospho-CoA kinase